MTDSDSSGQSGWNNPAQGASGGGYGYPQGGNPYGGQPAGNPYGYPQQPQQPQQGGYGYPQATPGYGAQQPDASGGANPYGNQYADPYGAAQGAAPGWAGPGGYGAAAPADPATIRNMVLIAQGAGGVAAGLSVLRSLLVLIGGLAGQAPIMLFLRNGFFMWVGVLLSGAAAWAALNVVKSPSIEQRTKVLVGLIAVVAVSVTFKEAVDSLAGWMYIHLH